jgi:fructose-1,6-bisphosphatase/inositol monophosphatase family enzyme
MTVDTAKVAAHIKDCAEEIVLPAFRNLDTLEIGLKGPNDFVTAADVASEAFLTPKLLSLLPGSVVVGEETAGDEAIWRESLRSAPAAWLIDPIDGTANFAAGIPLFGIMVALVEHGETTHAWIYDPNTGEMAIAQRGAGAWLGETRLSVADRGDVSSMQGSLNTRFAGDDEAALLFRASRTMAPTLEARSAAQSYLYLASGRSDFVLYHKLYPWDHAAGVLLHAEAGGCARHRDGVAYRPYGPTRGNTLVLAPNEDTWRVLTKRLYEGT